MDMFKIVHGDRHWDTVHGKIAYCDDRMREGLKCTIKGKPGKWVIISHLCTWQKDTYVTPAGSLETRDPYCTGPRRILITLAADYPGSFVPWDCQTVEITEVLISDQSVSLDLLYCRWCKVMGKKPESIDSRRQYNY